MTVTAEIPASKASSASSLGLTELQFDALGEAFNLSLGEAAATFSQLVSEEIEISVPTVELISRQELVSRIERTQGVAQGKALCGITQQFETVASFRTQTMLVFPEKGGLEIVRRMLGDTVPVESVTELEEDALSEVGNIIINSCMSCLSNLFKREIVGTLPVCKIADAPSLLGSDGTEKQILVAHIAMRMSVQDVSGYVLFMMDMESIQQLVREVDNVFQIDSYAAR
jgi:chemotaxis protein CheC